MMEKEAGVGLMRVFVEVIDPVCIEQGRATAESVNCISLSQKKFRELSTVLARDSCNERSFLIHYVLLQRCSFPRGVSADRS